MDQKPGVGRADFDIILLKILSEQNNIQKRAGSRSRVPGFWKISLIGRAVPAVWQCRQSGKFSGFGLPGDCSRAKENDCPGAPAYPWQVSRAP
jgi:hypothetical protein